MTQRAKRAGQEAKLLIIPPSTGRDGDSIIVSLLADSVISRLKQQNAKEVVVTDHIDMFYAIQSKKHISTLKVTWKSRDLLL